MVVDGRSILTDKLIYNKWQLSVPGAEAHAFEAENSNLANPRKDREQNLEFELGQDLQIRIGTQFQEPIYSRSPEPRKLIISKQWPVKSRS